VGGITDVELGSNASVAGVVLTDEVYAVVVFDAVEVASVVVAVKAATMPVLKVPTMMRLITRTLAAENEITLFFITYLVINNKKVLVVYSIDR
jgi:hypothetical protein